MNRRCHLVNLIAVSQERSSFFSSKLELEPLEDRRLLTGKVLEFDVNLDGHESPVDVLAIVNHLNLESEISENNDLRTDFDHDGKVTKQDAALVINHLNRAPKTSTDSIGFGEGSVAGSSTDAEARLHVFAQMAEGEGGSQGCGDGSPSNPVAEPLDLEIWNGGYAEMSGSQVVFHPVGKKATDEDNVGAFTVTNWNDTDGDGKNDLFDDKVTVDKEKDPDYMGPPRGTGEVDLMRVRMHKPNAFDECGGQVRLEVSGFVRFWKNSWKGELWPTLTWDNDNPNNNDWPASKDYIDLYAEVTNPSDTLRDIEIEMTYRDYPTDSVRATGIWVHSNGGGFDPEPWDYADIILDPEFSDIPNSAIDGFLKPEAYGGSGVRKNSDGGDVITIVDPLNSTPKEGIYNAMFIKFKVVPHGVGNEPGVKIDLTRRIESRQYIADNVTGNNPTMFGEIDYPHMLDAANDDPYEVDEDNTPLTSQNPITGNPESIMYTIDAPGLDNTPPSFPGLDDEWRSMVYNFEEFARVNVNGIDPTGGTSHEGGAKLRGSRASFKVKWYVRHTLLRDGSWWKRCCDGAWYDGHNVIDLGETDLGP